MPLRQWIQPSPVAEEQRARKLAQIAWQVQSLHQTTQELFTLPVLPSAPAPPQLEAAPAPAPQPAPAQRRSTERGEGRLKLIAALTKQHQYADGGCLTTEPVRSTSEPGPSLPSRGRQLTGRVNSFNS
jgi:hypothetical protein